ncbi:heparinase II/III-like protein [Prauserella shujinwangii]|uniref:Heparinase II/III-like protein n=1 Tax=Prauserella shujinwangii TaxID=1453103 RepID=A0A2T0LQM8_9PSEU|nr:alginate lyase family protein [Prauserella shujinwangii]PRX45635.1 heparinase II/III-like protein [Prauserella shujinwangii]
MTSAGWYLRRLSRMGPREVAGRAADTVRRRRWRGVADEPARHTWLPGRRFPATLGPEAWQPVGADAAARLVATADELLDGHAEYFGVPRRDMVSPDWSLDPKTGRRAPSETYTFDIPYRDEVAVGDIKQIWEPSRHQHLTVLAAAYARTGDDRYASRVADHLKSWWAANPPLRGVHWVSGIELGIRLLSWVWVRRLLDGWPGAPGLFEDNPEALHQIWFHQRWLAAFGSRGSSANNHVIAEAAGQLAAACAFDWFPESAGWRADALRSLDEHLRANTFGSGLNRELATEYHGLVLELGLAGAAEAAAAGVPVPETTWLTLLRMCDALAAMVDSTLHPPRQGDADDGHGLVLDGTGTGRWASLLATGGVLFGRLGWWPDHPEGDVRTALLTALAGPVLPAVTMARPALRPGHFADAGLTLLRTPADDPGPELWCRCDGGPHGFLSIAAHAHADALSLEVRHGGVELLADPGTYCYHGEPRWRSYFRSTLGHNTLELDGRDQSVPGGPFLWTRHARSRVLVAHTPDRGVARWTGEHDGYGRRKRPAVHRRTVELDLGTRELRVSDEVRGDGTHPCRLAFHLGPRVEAELTGHSARLAWTGDGTRYTADLTLPAELSWTAHRGEADPPLGWYSPGFGRKEPATTLLGTGRVGGPDPLITVLRPRT